MKYAAIPDWFLQQQERRMNAEEFMNNTIDVGAEYSNADGTMFGAFLQEMSNPETPYRVQWYDDRGLSGHTEAATVQAGIDLLLSDLGPDLKLAPGSMDKLFTGWHMKEAIRLLRQAEGPDYMYHSAPKTLRDTILAEGLKINQPYSKTREDAVNRFYKGVNPVYLSTDKGLFYNPENDVIFRVDVSGLPLVADLNSLYEAAELIEGWVDENNGGIAFNEDAIPFEIMDYIVDHPEDENLVLLSFEHLTNPDHPATKYIIAATRSAACIVDIPPERISEESNIKQAMKLLAKSLYDTDFKDIPADYIGIDDSASMEHYLMYYAMHKGYDPYDYPEEEITEDSPEFKEWLRDTMEDRFTEIEWDMKEALNEDETMDLYRKMTVPDDWMEHLAEHGKHLGVYWTHDKGSAEAHWGKTHHQQTVLIHGKVPETSVDWISTFIMNLDPSLGEDEKEVRLEEGVPVEVLEISIEGIDQDIAALEGRTFYA